MSDKQEEERLRLAEKFSVIPWSDYSEKDD